MILGSFKEERQQAHRHVKNKGFLTYHELCQFMSIQEKRPDISEEVAGIFQALLEVHCARFVQPVWQNNSAESFKHLPEINMAFSLLLLSEPSPYKNTHLIPQMASSMSLMSQTIADCEFNNDYPSVFFSNASLDEPTKIKTHGAFQASVAAISAIAHRTAPLTTDIPDNWSPDPEGQLAVQCAAEVTDFSANVFWHWYINKAFPQALADLPKYLKIGHT